MRVLDQALTFNGNASDQNCIAIFPPSLRGQYVEFIVYIIFSTGSAAGKVQIETAHDKDYSGTWATVGNTIDFAAATSEKYAAVTGVFGALRLRIDTAVTTGTVSGWVVASTS